MSQVRLKTSLMLKIIMSIKVYNVYTLVYWGLSITKLRYLQINTEYLIRRPTPRNPVSTPPSETRNVSKFWVQRTYDTEKIQVIYETLMGPYHSFVLLL